MSSWWYEVESGAGQAAVEDVGTVLELAKALSNGGDQVVGVGEWIDSYAAQPTLA